MRQVGRSSSRRIEKGFTLLELLAVIAIIVVLVALLLPALSLVRRGAQRVGCISNLHQLAVAFQAYTIDNDNTLPTGMDNATSPSQFLAWFPPAQIKDSALCAYIAPDLYAKILVCPADPNPEDHLNTFGAVYPYSYAMNNTLNLFPWSPLGFMPLRRISKPSQKALLVDVEYCDNSLYDYWFTPTAGLGLVERLSTRHDPRWRPQDVEDISVSDASRTGMFANALFCDFHVGLIDASHENDPAYFVP